MNPRIDGKIGDRITLNLVNGAGMTGEIVDARLDEDGCVEALAIRDDPSRPDPLWVRGDLIAIWRLGAPVTKPEVVPIRVPPGAMNGLRLEGS